MHPSHNLNGRVDGREFFNLERDGLTQGTLMKWMLCPEKARLGTLNGLGMSGKKDAIEFGNIIHKNLEMVYTDWGTHKLVRGEPFDFRGVQDASAVALRRQEMECYPDIKNEADARVMELNYALAAEILPIYWNTWRKDFETVDWVSLEQEFAIPYETTYGNPAGNCGVAKFPLRGKIDGVFRSRMGSQALWVMDTKTKSNIDEPTIPTRLGYDFQMGMYMWAVSQIYSEEPFGLWYNLIKRPQLRQKVSESIPQFARRCGEDARADLNAYFKRIEVVILPEERNRFRQELMQVIESFVEWYYTAKPHFRNSANCHNGMWKCEFIEVCGNNNYAYVSQRDKVYPELDGTG